VVVVLLSRGIFFAHSCNACANRNAVGALELETKCTCDESGREEEEEDANRTLSASFMFALFSLSLSLSSRFSRREGSLE